MSVAGGWAGRVRVGPEHGAGEGEALAVGEGGQLGGTARQAGRIVDAADAIDEALLAHAIELAFGLDEDVEAEQQGLGIGGGAEHGPGAGPQRVVLTGAWDVARDGQNDGRRQREGAQRGAEREAGRADAAVDHDRVGRVRVHFMDELVLVVGDDQTEPTIPEGVGKSLPLRRVGGCNQDQRLRVRRTAEMRFGHCRGWRQNRCREEVTPSVFWWVLFTPISATFLSGA